MELSFLRRLSRPKRIGNIVIVLAFVLVIAVVLLAAFRPNRGASLFGKAQRLEAAGQWQQALGHYGLLVQTMPESSLAPRALMQQGTILEGMARRSGKNAFFQRAINFYTQIPKQYPGSAIAGSAMLHAADLASRDLQNYTQAAQLYQEVLHRFSRNPDYGSQAVLALGNIALARKDGAAAQKYFRQVLTEYNVYPERCAQAQYNLGIVAETLTHQPQKAKDAYLKTIKIFPDTVWAVNAKARLGMLFYGDIAPGGPARRVVTRLQPLPNLGYHDNAPYLPLALVLSARGIKVNPAMLTAWSLEPFLGGYNPNHPGRVLQLSNGFENAAANAGLTFSVHQAKDEKTAFAALREAVDRGQTPVIYLDNWRFVVGYDTVAQTILLQKSGARFDAIPLKELMPLWAKSKPRTSFTDAKPYTFLAFKVAEDGSSVVAKNISKTGKNATRLFMTPSFELLLDALPVKAAHQRTINQAASLLQRAHWGEALLNVEALGQLASELSLLGTPPTSPVPVPEAASDGITASDMPNLQQRLERAQKIAPWFGEPLQHWIEARRDAAVYLDKTGNLLNNSQLKGAASQMRHSMMALENAARNFPDGLKSGSISLWTTSLGQQLVQSAQDLREAEIAETKAAELMRDAS